VLFASALSYSPAIGMGAYSDDSPAGPAGGRLGTDLAAHVESIVRAAEREARVAEQAIADQRRSAEEEARRYLAAARLQVDAEAAAHAARVETLSSAARRLSDELSDAVSALRRELERDPDAALPRPPWPAQAAAAAPPRAAAPPPPAAEPARSAEAAPAMESPAAPEPTWSRLDAEPPAAAADADRAGGTGEHDSASLLAERPSPVTGPARSMAGPEHVEPATTNGPEAEAPEPVATNGQAGDQPPVPSAARLVAIEMAVGGSSRAEVEQHLRGTLGVADPQPLLDDVFGVASHAGSRLAWGEP
jgi:hypothetical protein